MTLTKKHWTAIIALIIVLLLVWYFFLRKKPIKILAGAPATTPPVTNENSFRATGDTLTIKSHCRTCFDTFSMDCKSASSTVMQTPGLAKFNQVMWDNAINKLVACAKVRTGKKVTVGPTCIACVNAFLMDLKGASGAVMQTPGYVTFNEVMLENAAKKLVLCSES